MYVHVGHQRRRRSNCDTLHIQGTLTVELSLALGW